MKLPQLQFRSTAAKIGLKIDKPIQKIEQPEPEMVMNSRKPILKINTIRGKLSIDQTKAWEDMDLKSIFKRTEDFANQGKQDLQAGIARRAVQGDELMRIENKGTPLASQAKTNSEGEPLSFNIGWIPSHHSVEITYTPTEVKIDSNPGEVKIDVETSEPVHQYTPGKVTAYMENYPSLKISYSETNDGTTL